MKHVRILSLLSLLLLLAATLLTSCTAPTGEAEAEEMIALPDGKVLRFADGDEYKNTTKVEETVERIPFVTAYTYNLRRATSAYSAKSPYEYYNGYYYYWEVETRNAEILLGTKTVSTRTEYSYLPLSRDHENLVLVTTTTVETSFTYQTEERPLPVTVVVNPAPSYGLYTLAELEAALPELAAIPKAIDTAATVYVDAAVPTTTTQSIQRHHGTHFTVVDK